MLQLQYYNKGLTKTQIEHILKNYNLRYTTIAQEINAKLSSLIKTVINDISPFLENIEVLSKEMKKIKLIENNTEKIESLEKKLREKSEIEIQLQNDIISLKNEISLLKQKNNQNNLIDNLINKQDNDNPSTSRNKNRKKNESNNNSTNDNGKKSLKKESDILSDKSKQNIALKSDSTMSNKNNKKGNNNLYMMNMQEITRNINGNHEQQQKIGNFETANKALCFSNTKKTNKNNNNNKIEKKNKRRSTDLSLSVTSNSKNNITNRNKSNIKEDNKIIQNQKIEENDLDEIEEEYDEEIKELEIDEQNILQLIEDIKNFENKNI